ncbi:MAG: M24 family metallopeptidase [Gemmatimonadales bacterium]|nr:MAG: M24 family metallopeptidase [Gemmatimonadales bacterium]
MRRKRRPGPRSMRARAPYPAGPTSSWGMWALPSFPAPEAAPWPGRCWTGCRHRCHVVGGGGMNAGKSASEAHRLGGMPREVFARRRRRVLERLGDDVMILPAAPALIRSRDSELPYRPDSELFYLSGCREPEALLVLVGRSADASTVMFTRVRDPEQERWTGPRVGVDAAPTLYGVDRAFPVGELSRRLPELLEGAERIHHRLGVHPSLDAMVVDALRVARIRGARTGRGPRAVVDPGGILDELRLRKGPEEIVALREAVEATIHGFRAGMAVTAPGVGEWEIQAEVEAAFRRAGAEGPAFGTIVGSGPNGCVLHYVDNNRRVAAGDLVLLDAGAEVRLYAGDLTRTFPASGRFTPEQEAVYEVVESARRVAVEAVAPGVTVQEVHRQAETQLLLGLRELGLLSGSVDELRARKAHRSYFPHRTSHWLGMDTHDPGDYVVDGGNRPLEPGMVLTVEPGLYFPPGPVGTSGDHPFAGIGIRIEDDVLVTEEGRDVLSEALPTDPAQVAALVGRAGR